VENIFKCPFVKRIFLTAISGEVFKKFVLIFSGFSLAFKAPFVLCFCLSGLGIRID